MKCNFNTHLSGKFDEKRKVLRDVSIITEGAVLGHPFVSDVKTLQGVVALMQDKRAKAYWRHSREPDRLGEEVGLLYGAHISGNQVKASFEIFDSFKKNFATRWDYLQEFVEHAPSEIGLSIHFEGDGAWVLNDGTEVSMFDVQGRPENAVHQFPSARVETLFSADVVSSPAANVGGMFSQGKLTELLDTKQKLSGDVSDLSAKLATSAEQITAKDTAFAELAAKHDAANKTLEAERAAFATKETEFAAQKTGLETKVKEFTAQVASLSKVIADMKAEGEAKAKEFALQIEAKNKVCSSGAPTL